jgi:hypothetical protein
VGGGVKHGGGRLGRAHKKRGRGCPPPHRKTRSDLTKPHAHATERRASPDYLSSEPCVYV